MLVSCTLLGAANSINIRFIIFDCYVKRELKFPLCRARCSTFFLSFHLIKFHEVNVLKDLWDNSRAFVREIDFNQYDYVLMTHRAIVRVTVTSMIVSGECLQRNKIYGTF